MKPTDVLDSKLVNKVMETTEKVSFDAKLSVGYCKLSVLRPMPSTFNVFQLNINCGKIHRGLPLFSNSIVLQLDFQGSVNQTQVEMSTPKTF